MENEWMANILLKEPKFFNRWPMPPTEWYMHAWNSTTIGEILAGVTKNKVLLDSSPQYLMVPTAAARVKASVPHAKFVIVVRVRSCRFSGFSFVVFVCESNIARTVSRCKFEMCSCIGWWGGWGGR